MKTVFLRLLGAEDKAVALLQAIREEGECRFLRDSRSFSSVPRSPFAYWVGDQLRALFRRLPSFETQGRAAKQGLSTADDFRFVRLSWEGADIRGESSWLPFAKGGAHSRYYSDVYLVAKWLRSGRELYAAGAAIRNPGHYRRPGLTWPRRTQGGLSLRAMPAGCLFADKGPAAFVEDDSSEELLALLAITNGRAFEALVDMQMAFGSYEVGVLQRTPIPHYTAHSRHQLAALARRAWLHKRTLDTSTEISHAFCLPALLQVSGATLVKRHAVWSEHVSAIAGELPAIQAEIDDHCSSLYGIDDVERRAMSDGFGLRDSSEGTSEGDVDVDDDVPTESSEDNEEDVSISDAGALATHLLSWVLGVAFSRFDVRLATGACPLPVDPEPFDPLPPCPPGMLTGTNGLPLDHPPVDYPLGFPEMGVLVDDPGHAQDIESALRAVFDLVFGEDADRWWTEVAALLDPKSHDLREWLANSFLEHHIKLYSKSRRKAPIYWQLATPSASYSLWLYAHRLTRDSFFQIQKDIVGPKLMHEENELARLGHDAGPTPTSDQRKVIATQEEFVAELRAFRDEIARVAPLWNPNLDDGIVITAAPLWRLFPHHKAWQKELKGYWDELCAGKYDWSHLAMHLWPERVVPVCATDRSIAIAHDLEEVFWVEDAKGKWKPRSKPTRPIEELVAERTSPAVKEALKSLLEAPVASGTSTKRSRSRRK